MNATDPIRPKVSKVKVSVEKIYQDPPTHTTTILMTATGIINDQNFNNYPKLRFAGGFEFSTVGMEREFFNPPTNQVTYTKKILFEYRSDITVEVDELRDGDWGNSEFKHEGIS